MVDFMLSNPAEVVQFADFGPRLALNSPSDESFLLKSFQSTPLSSSPRMANSLSKTTVNLDQEGVREGRVNGAGPSAGPATGNAKGRRKRPRTAKTSEEVESQRMTHIAVERNRRRQMNEYLRVLRSLMPGSYVQRVCFPSAIISLIFLNKNGLFAYVNYIYSDVLSGYDREIRLLFQRCCIFRDFKTE
jgi:Helix-loop-helix DNA-binding domain